MEYLRNPRPLGSTVVLGGISYRLEAVEGCGSSAIVYRASYPDNLDHHALHQVFLKELFPLSPHGEIRRDESGAIVCQEGGRHILEEAQRRFRLGNQINLELLSRYPASIAGNLNSYQAYGTYYSVHTVHGGENLLRHLEARKRLPIGEAAEILGWLLQALEGFHRRGLLHLDVSPDNILLLPKQVLLIDFNSVWDTRHPDQENFFFSYKPGYSPPEVLLKNSAEIGPATDLYACCAVFFHMLTGHRLQEEVLQGGLRKVLAGPLPGFSELPQSAGAKAREILFRGLHPLPRRRYQSISALQRDLQELLCRLGGTGVTLSALWEASAAAQHTGQRPLWDYLAQPVQAGSAVLTQASLAEQLSEGGCYLLTGPGGMGKTRLLEEVWAQQASRYRGRAPVFYYISLRDYQAMGADDSFLRRTILQALRFSPEESCYADALHALELLFSQRENGQASVVLLLDGLNEAGPQREALLREMEELSARSGVGILATDRTPAVLDYALPGFVPLTLSPLSEAQVSEQFSARGLQQPANDSLRRLLTTPMLLFLYLESTRLPSGTQTALPESQDELLSLYLDRFCRQSLREDSGSQASQLISQYALLHLLPSLAGEMKRRERSALPVDTVRSLAQQSYRLLRSYGFAAAFPEYLGKSRLMLAGLDSADEWYDLVVRERLLDRFGLLAQTPQGQITLFHDAFLPILSQQAEENLRRWRQKTAQRWRRRLIAAIAAVVLIGGAAASGAWYLASRQAYTAAEQGEIYDALTNLNGTLGVWSNRMTAQQQCLERASLSDVLDNQDDWARGELAQQIEQQRQLLDTLYTPVLEEAALASLEAIQQCKPLFSPEILETLLAECAALEGVSDSAMDHLEAALCTPESVYNTRDKRERVVNAYQAYLDAETRYVSYLLAALLAEMTPDQQGEIMEAMTYMQALDGFYDGPGSVASERLSDGTDQAREAVMAARTEMLAQGFPMDTTG